MGRAIAAGRRLCQAAATAVVLLHPCQVARAQTSSSQPDRYFQALTPDGVRVRETCLASGPSAPEESPCGTLANRAIDIITRLSALVGPFPEKSLAIDAVGSAGRPPAAKSTPGRIHASESILRFAGSDTFAPEVLPRAIAQQWFLSQPELVKAGDVWLLESLPEYLGWRYLLNTNGEAARVEVAMAMRDSLAEGRVRPLSVGIEPSTNASEAARAIFRRRGLLVLRTLETVIDRERLDRVLLQFMLETVIDRERRALPEFMRRYPGGPLSTAEFEKVCEEIAGRKLEWFFDYFIRGTQIPEIELRRVLAETPGVAAGEIVVKDFPAEGSVRVEMSVRTAQGIVEHSVATRGAVTPFTVNVPAPALGITLDPDLRILCWTEAARRSKAQSALLAALPDPVTSKNLPAAIELYRRALAADPDDAARRAQALHERLGELEWAHDEWNAALADLDAAINGHSISPFETFLCRAKAYLYHGVVQLHERRPTEAQKDARAGLALPRFVLLQAVPREPIESRGDWTLEHLLETLSDAASHY